MLTVHVITLFEEVLKPYTSSSIIGRAVKAKKLAFKFYNPINEGDRKGSRIDDRPYGGGPGMVLQPLPFLKAWKKAKGRSRSVKTIFFDPNAKVFNQEKAKELSNYRNIILLCGHYEGIDDRVSDATDAERISVGPYTLTGGELPALILADSIAREIPGVLGNLDSLESRRVAASKSYTRPKIFEFNGRKYKVPDILLSGDHKNIDKFRGNTR